MFAYNAVRLPYELWTLKRLPLNRLRTVYINDPCDDGKHQHLKHIAVCKGGDEIRCFMVFIRLVNRVATALDSTSSMVMPVLSPSRLAKSVVPVK